jgi:hypothetical protein
LAEILRSFENSFVPRLGRSINKKRKELNTSSLLRSAQIRDKVTSNEGDNDKQEQHDDDDDDNADDEPLKVTVKQDVIDNDDDLQAMDIKQEEEEEEEEEVPGTNEPPTKKSKTEASTYNERFGNVCKHVDDISEYTADLDESRWCRLKIVFLTTQVRIDLKSLIRSEALTIASSWKTKNFARAK